MRFFQPILFLILTNLYLLCGSSFAQVEEDSLSNSKLLAPKVYLDCNRCDFNYIRREITFVNYVRDRKVAEVHLMVTTQRTGSGGTEYTLHFLGQNNYAGMNDTLIYATNQTDTREERRAGYTRSMKLGLIRYAAKTPIANQIDISYKEPANQEEVVDKWNYWVFRTNANTFFFGQESTSFLNLNGSVRATRITDHWKIRSNFNIRYNEQNFETTDGDTKYITRNYNFSTLIVKSINNHWSIGGRTFTSTSTFNNTKFRAGISPAIEYNFFPYSESTRKEFRINYSLNYNNVRYEEITVFDKTKETLFNQELGITLEVNQTWGSAETRLEALNYLHDFSLNRVELSAELDLKLFKGFSLRLDGEISSIRDQISLPKEEASDEEILLGRVQLPTSFQYFGSIGISYTFGSIYSNIVNSRFGR